MITHAHRRSAGRILCGLILSAFLASIAVPPLAAREPLLMQGKTSLFQRVLARPGAEMRNSPDGDPADASAQPRAFDIYYVFARQGDWIEVGGSFGGENTGWIRQEQTVDWKQTIVVSFTNPADRERSLLFDSRETIEAILNAEDFVGQLAALRQQAIDETLPDDTPVRAIEPENHLHVDIEDSFYLLPILDHATILNPSDYEDLQLLEVAAVAANAEVGITPDQGGEAPDYKTGVMFVIDTTRSMGPYIEQTRRAVRQIMTRLQETELADSISFGLVGFRDSIEAAPDLDYVFNTFVPLAPDQDIEQVFRDLDEVREAEANSPGFNEDVYAGFSDVLKDEIWKPYQGRYVVLITDAGPKLADHSTIGDLASSQQLGLLAADQLKISTYVMHLRTTDGAATHDYAQGEYLQLAQSVAADPDSRYYPIADATEEAFVPAIDRFVRGLEMAEQARNTGNLEEAIEQAEPGMIQDILRDTLAKQLAYLGAREGEQVPSVFNAWISHRVLEDTRKNALQVRLLITKNQLDTLSQVVKSIIDAAGGVDSDSTEFFGRLQSALASMARDPSLVVNAEFETLGETLGEFLDDLPYRSEILEMSQERWLNLSSPDQHVFLQRLKAKVKHFEKIHDTSDRWTTLHDDTPPGEAVYPIRLEMLP